MEKTCKIVANYGFYRPITFNKNGLLLYKKNKLFYMNSQREIHFFKNLKIEGWRGRLSINRFITRLMHRYVFCGITDSSMDYSYFAANDGVYALDNRTNNLKYIFKFSPRDMHRPLNFFEIKDVYGFENCIVFGDYSYNEKRKEMSIYTIIGEKVCKVYTFEENTIRHIHSIICDKYRNRVLVLTGDRDSECAIWEFENNFNDLKELYRGQQSYRFCAAKAYSDGVVLVTDSPFDQNYVYKMKEDNHIVEIGKLMGPVVFFSYFNDDLVFSTDVENDEKSLSKMQEFFINKKGDGVLDDHAHVYIYSNRDESICEICKFKKDHLPMRIFGFGTVHFPIYQAWDFLFLFPMGVKKYDQRLLEIEVD